MLRRVTLSPPFTLLLVLHLLLGIVTIPTSAMVVCRMTGMPMPQEAASATVPVVRVRSCCAGKKPVFTAVHHHRDTPLMGRMPCCELRAAAPRSDSPALASTRFELPIAVLTIGAVLPIPPTSAVAIRIGLVDRQMMPRAPPDDALPARAPPALS